METRLCGSRAYSGCIRELILRYHTLYILIKADWDVNSSCLALTRDWKMVEVFLTASSRPVSQHKTERNAM